MRFSPALSSILLALSMGLATAQTAPTEPAPPALVAHEETSAPPAANQPQPESAPIDPTTLPAQQAATNGTNGMTRTIRGGWYLWNPYQYLKVPGEQGSLTGLDIEMSKLILKKAGLEPDFSYVTWKEHQAQLKEGKRDFAMGAFYSDTRASYSYIPQFYRYEENSLFFRRADASKHTSYKDVNGFMAYIKENKLKIGVVDGYNYATQQLNDFIADPANADIFVRTKTDNESLKLLISGKIDAFLADRIVGATIIWHEKVGRMIDEKNLNIKAPIHMLLSKQTTSEQTFKDIDRAIGELKQSDEYAKAISWYLYPILLLKTTDSQWFMFIEILGIIAFAISGLVVAYRSNATLFGGFILCLLPSFGGGVLRDVIFGRYPIWFLQARAYLFLVIAIVLIGFALIKFNAWMNGSKGKLKGLTGIESTHKAFDTILMVTDAIGLAAFTVTGVLVSMIVKADPLWLWGPFFAFLTGAGGGMLRDLMAKTEKVEAISGGIYPEIAIFWGGALSVYLHLNAFNVDPDVIQYAVMTTIGCAFLTRLVIFYLHVPNLRFSKNGEKEPW